MSLSLLALLFLVSCTGKDPYRPGTSLGRYEVEGTLGTNSCGGEAINPWVFQIDLATDPGKLYWIQGTAPVSGSLEDEKRAELTATQTRNIHEADRKKQLGACSIIRDDKVSLTLSRDDSSFTGKLTYSFRPATENDDCSDQEASSGGTFAALPCRTEYTLKAARKAR